jgi:hypothetical protein
MRVNKRDNDEINEKKNNSNFKKLKKKSHSNMPLKGRNSNSTFTCVLSPKL